MSKDPHLSGKYKKQLKRVKYELIFGIIVTICIAAIVVAVGLHSVETQAKHYANDVRIDYSNIVDSYVRVFDTVYDRIVDKIKEDPSLAEMDEWLRSQDEAFAQAMGKEVYDGIAITYKGGYAHSWDYGDYSDYDATTRPWYQTALKADGKTAVVPPYVTFLDSQYLNDDSYILMSIVRKYNDEIFFDYDIKLTEIERMLRNQEHAYFGTEVLMFDPDGYILSCSDEGKFAHNIYEPDDSVSQSLSAALETAGNHRDKLLLKMVDGTATYLYFDMDSGGNGICILIPFYEVVKEDFIAILLVVLLLILFELYLYRRSKESLVEYNNRDEQLSAITDAAFLESLYVNLGTMTFYGSPGAEQLFPNRLYKDLFDYLGDRVNAAEEKEAFYQFLSPQCLVKTVAEQGHLESERFGMNWTQPDGSLKQREMEVSRIFSVFNGTKTVCLLLRDVSEDAAILKDALSQANSANAAKSELLTRVSHDIRTPLNVIIGMSHLAKENDNPADTTECLEKIDVSSEFLLGLINDVLDLERIERGKIQLQLAAYSSDEFTQYLSAVIRPLCEEKSIHFNYIIEKQNSFIVMQDKLRINQVYFNLLSNAVKFTPKGGTIDFHTTASQVGDRVRLDVTIADSGIGISEEFQNQMFESFTQENRTDLPFSTGSGLGLAIVKRLCDLMGMTISVKSELGQGTTFFVHGEYDLAKEMPQEVKAEKVDSADLLAGKTILICEDHPLNQEITCRLLKKKGVSCIVAKDGKCGVEAFMESSPGSIDAILMDIRMPVMDGLEAAQEIRRLERKDAKTVPMIALSANAYEEDVKRCAEAGMNDHLAKPFSPEKLFRVLIKHLFLS